MNHPQVRRAPRFSGIAALLLATTTAGFAQQPAKPPADPVQEKLRAAFAVLSRSYPKMDGRRQPKAPADAVWALRATKGADGTAEVGFRAGEVVYMVFRRGLGGTSWGHEDITALYSRFYSDLLKEIPGRERYTPSLAREINAALICRRDFDSGVLLTGQ